MIEGAGSPLVCPNCGTALSRRPTMKELAEIAGVDLGTMEADVHELRRMLDGYLPRGKYQET